MTVHIPATPTSTMMMHLAVPPFQKSGPTPVNDFPSGHVAFLFADYIIIWCLYMQQRQMQTIHAGGLKCGL